MTNAQRLSDFINELMGDAREIEALLNEAENISGIDNDCVSRAKDLSQDMQTKRLTLVEEWPSSSGYIDIEAA